jgi:beta-galactosidase
MHLMGRMVGTIIIAADVFMKKHFQCRNIQQKNACIWKSPASAYSAEVTLNGNLLGTHEGGYSLFRFDLTDLLQEQNTIQIVVSNEAKRSYLSTVCRFTFYGGLYRGVNLVIVPKQHFAMLDDGSNGIYVTPKVAEDYQSAEVEVKADQWLWGSTLQYWKSDCYC